MAYGRKWRPSKSAAREFAEKMNAITDFCIKNHIVQSKNGDSYYFCIGETAYRVSNHTTGASNAAAFNEFGEQLRELYHTANDPETVQILAGKTRIMEIYADLQAGHSLDSRGRRI